MAFGRIAEAAHFGSDISLDDIRLVKCVGLAALLDFAEEPAAVDQVVDPELLEARRGGIASDERPGAVVGEIVAGAGCDQGGELALLGPERVTKMNQVHAFYFQVCDMVDFIVPDHCRQLHGVRVKQVGHQQWPHREIVARLPALLKFDESGADQLLQLVGINGWIMDGEQREQLLGRSRPWGNNRGGIDEFQHRGGRWPTKEFPDAALKSDKQHDDCGQDQPLVTVDQRVGLSRAVAIGASARISPVAAASVASE